MSFSILGPIAEGGLKLPLCSFRVPAGFPSPAADHIVVLSNNDGRVIARSYDAKPYVKMGEPYSRSSTSWKSTASSRSRRITRSSKLGGLLLAGLILLTFRGIP